MSYYVRKFASFREIFKWNLRINWVKKKKQIVRLYVNKRFMEAQVRNVIPENYCSRIYRLFTLIMQCVIPFHYSQWISNRNKIDFLKVHANCDIKFSSSSPLQKRRKKKQVTLVKLHCNFCSHFTYVGYVLPQNIKSSTFRMCVQSRYVLTIFFFLSFLLSFHLTLCLSIFAHLSHTCTMLHYHRTSNT